jgi:dienelactone hydrolase
MDMLKPRQWELLAVLPILAGLYWLLASYGNGWLFWGLVPGTVMLSTGVALLLWPGDLRITEYMAGGALLGLLLVLPVMISGGFGDAMIAAAGAAASYLTAGRVSLQREPVAEGAPAPERELWVDAKAALDEALLAYFVGTARIPSGDMAESVCRRAGEMEAALEKGGWLKKPETLHPAPPAPESSQVFVQEARIYGHDFERLSYPSGFVPEAKLPGADEWHKHHRNRQCAAWVLRHPGPPRPWLMCVHGYRMGEAWLDLLLFPPAWLHEKLGLNLFMPILPLHGPRRAGLRSGDLYLDGDPMDLLFAQTQALWDLRRGLAWIRSQEENAQIGVLGYSLGGYNTALLVQYEHDLDFAIAGIPLVDAAAALWRHLPPWHRDYYLAHGLTPERYRTVLQPVSPLARAPQLDRERLYVFAGAADRVVLPEQPLTLAAHWNVPIQWYQGSHLTFRNEAVVREHIEAAMQRAGWATASQVAATG